MKNEIGLLYLMKGPSLILTLSLIICFSCSAEHMNLPNVSSGKIERLEDFHSDFITSRNVDIWLPEGYTQEDKYAVIYMHDGQMLFDKNTGWNGQEWGVDETLSRLIEKNVIRKCIVVGIWNSATRWADYFPEKAHNMLTPEFLQRFADLEYAHYDTFVQSDDYLKFIVEELKPYIDSHYSTRPGRESTFVAGSSMGGLISMYAICEYPDIFGGAACLSTHWVGAKPIENNEMSDAFVAYLQEYLPTPSTHKIYFDHGTVGLDQYYEPTQIRVDQIMREGGYTSENWMTRKFEGADHTENDWNSRLHVPITFLLGK